MFMKYPTLTKPVDPGFYWFSAEGEAPHIVEVGIESDSHGLYYVLLPDNLRKYPLDCFPGAKWFGPIDLVEQLVDLP